MNKFDAEPRVLSNGTGVAFNIDCGAHRVECIISIEALEYWFWLPAGAGEERVLATFLYGCERIVAVAARRWRVSPQGKVVLKVTDFDLRRR